MYEIELRTHPTLGISEVLAKVREFRNKNGDLLTALEYYHEDISNFTRTEAGKLGLKYKCHKLVYYEDFGLIDQAIEREKMIKSLSRVEKERLIDTINPERKDLYEQ